jgi:hypothetical protein
MRTVDTSAQPAGNAHPRKSAAPKAKPFGAKILAPLAWGARSVAWLLNSEKNGGAKFVLYGCSLYCFGICTETIYVSMPRSASAINNNIESVRFLPKPGIDDGADVAYLLPPVGNTLKRIANATIANVVPFYSRHQLNPRWSIWSDPNFYIAFGISSLVGLIEAKVLRRTANSWDKKQKKFQKYNSRQVPDLNPKAVMAASIARKELEVEGTGNYAVTAFVIASTYTIEFVCFFRSLGGLEIGVFTTLIYAIINVFGFEFCWAMASDPDEDEN